eukprot:4140847-Karenia_brevis.AAC.1
MMRPQVAPAIVAPVVPHECTPHLGIHTQGLPILLLQPIEASSTAACPGGEAPARLQNSKDCL